MDTNIESRPSPRASAPRAVVGRFAVRLAAVLAALAVLLVCWASIAPPAHAEGAAGTEASPIVQTDAGQLAGVATPTGVEFRGVPYAAPPTGDLRWRAPQPVPSWSGVRDASVFSPVCPQGPPSPNGSSEDCLYLNVTAPAGALGGSTALPVIVWIHGGAFALGEGADYDPAKLADEGAVVVTINYRLGLLGFLAHPALADQPGGTTGNFGLMDQQAALRWVQANIARFGGDPGNVTIAGQSAGGLSVLEQLASPGARGLFHRAVVESGSFALVQKSLKTALAEGQASAIAVGCADQSAECLRAVPVDTLVANGPASIPPGYIDGTVVKESVGTAIAAGRFSKVPIINGVNTQEERLFVGIPPGLGVNKGATVLLPTPIDAANYKTAIQSYFGVNKLTAALIAAAYPLSKYASPTHAFTALNSDANFSCPAFALDTLASRYVPTFAYEFNDALAPELFVPDTLGPPLASTHQSELQYLFDQPNVPFPAPLSADQEALASSMRASWAQFARSGSPSTAETPWPRFDLAHRKVLSLEAPTSRVETGFAADHHCVLWGGVALFGSL